MRWADELALKILLWDGLQSDVLTLRKRAAALGLQALLTCRPLGLHHSLGLHDDFALVEHRPEAHAVPHGGRVNGRVFIRCCRSVVAWRARDAGLPTSAQPDRACQSRAG